MTTSLSFEQIRDAVRPAKLIAVSKLQPASAVQKLALSGQKIFAENYVQEAIEKIEAINDPSLIWHFIGSLQRNKVKFVVGQFELIHSVDRVELALEIQKHAAIAGIQQSILLEVNLSNEESKGGFKWDEDFSGFEKTALEIVKACPNAKVSGLMTMPPLFDDPEQSRPYFSKLRQLRDHLQGVIPTCSELSMGTSSDYKVAVEEGATFVRLGTVLFGPRPALKEK